MRRSWLSRLFPGLLISQLQASKPSTEALQPVGLGDTQGGEASLCFVRYVVSVWSDDCIDRVFYVRERFADDSGKLARHLCQPSFLVQGDLWPAKVPTVVSPVNVASETQAKDYIAADASAADISIAASSPEVVVAPVGEAIATEATDAKLAAALSGAHVERLEIFHPGVQGSSSVSIDRFEDQQTAMVTVRAAVRVTPCTGADGEVCVPIMDQEPGLDVAVAFAASAAAQAAVSCSKCDTSACTCQCACPRSHSHICQAHRICTAIFLCCLASLQSLRSWHWSLHQQAALPVCPVGSMNQLCTWSLAFPWGQYNSSSNHMSDKSCMFVQRCA
jgi:hypothetical protein